MSNELTYVVVDGENIDATLGMSVLDRRPNPEERPRWDRVLTYSRERWGSNSKGLFFLNASSGHMPMGFIQALVAMEYAPIPLASEQVGDKVVDIGIQRTLDAIIEQGTGDVLLASHDADFYPQVERLLENGHRVGIMCFAEFLSSQFMELEAEGLEIHDLEHDVKAFTVPLPRLRIIPLEEFDPVAFL